MKKIPLTDGFFADEKGNIFDNNKDICGQYTNGDGYKTAAVRHNGKWCTFGVHRLVALAYHAFNGSHLALTVNHLDGNITNNVPTNLEWETNTNNVTHGILLNRFTKRPMIVGSKNEKDFYFNDLSAAADYFAVQIETVWHAIRDNIEIKGWKIKHLKANSVKVFNLITAKPEHISQRIRKLTMLDLTTKEQKEFASIREAAKHFKVFPAKIRQRISTPNFPKVFKGNFVFVDKGESLNFVNDDLLPRTQRTAAKPIIVYEIATKSFKEYPAAAKFVKEHLEVSKKGVYTRLKNNRLNEVNGWIVKYVVNLEEDKKAILMTVRS